MRDGFSFSHGLKYIILYSKASNDHSKLVGFFGGEGAKKNESPYNFMSNVEKL